MTKTANAPQSAKTAKALKVSQTGLHKDWQSVEDRLIAFVKSGEGGHHRPRALISDRFAR